MVVLLRRTNRLALHLASNGYALYQDHKSGPGSSFPFDTSLCNPVEVEFFSSSAVKPTENTRWAFPIPCKTSRYFESLSWLTALESDGTADYPFPPQTDDLFRWLKFFLSGPCDEYDRGYVILPFQERRHRKLFLKRMKGARSTRSRSEADILWLSATAFVSLHRFRYPEHSYAMSLDQWKLLAYSLPHLDNADGTFRSGPVSDLPLRFLYHVLAPICYQVSALEIKLESATPVDAMVTLLPRIDQAPMNNTTIFFPNVSIGLLQAISSFPFHPRVRFRLEAGYGQDHITPQQLNDLLLSFRLPVHLQLPRALLDFESENESFTTNPCITSLTISTGTSRLSTKMLNGIARNENMEHLVIDCQDRPDLMLAPSVIKAVACSVLQGGRNLKCLTLESQYQNSKAETPKGFLEAFEQLGKDLDFTSHRGHCIARFHWRFPFSRGMPRLKSNKLWDSEFSPTLVLNCLHQQPGGCPPAIMLGLASRRINQGILFEYSTNLVPWDLSASNASAIFVALYHSVDYYWLRKE
jgi:hypothetical protein